MDIELFPSPRSVTKRKIQFDRLMIVPFAFDEEPLRPLLTMRRRGRPPEVDNLMIVSSVFDENLIKGHIGY